MYIEFVDILLSLYFFIYPFIHFDTFVHQLSLSKRNSSIDITSPLCQFTIFEIISLSLHISRLFTAQSCVRVIIVTQEFPTVSTLLSLISSKLKFQVEVTSSGKMLIPRYMKTRFLLQWCESKSQTQRHDFSKLCRLTQQ